MTAQVIDDTRCLCGHLLHTSEYGCEDSECDCEGFHLTPRRPPVAEVSDRPTVEQLVRAGRRSQTKRIAALASRIESNCEQLRDLLAAERQAAEAKRERDALASRIKAEIAELEKQLAAKKAEVKLAGGQQIAQAAGGATCPDCGRSGFKNLGAHRFRAHRTTST